MRLYKNPPNNTFRYGGTLDFKCKMLSNPPVTTEKVIYIIDFKTGTKPKPARGYVEWALQTASYRNADGEALGNGVVHLNNEDGTPTWYDYTDTYESDIEAFKFLLAYWHNRHPEAKGLPSSTTVGNLLNKPALVYWAANCTCEYIQDNLPFGEESMDTFYPQAMAVIEKARKEFRSVSKKAMDIGSLTHEAIELYLKHKIEPPKNTPDKVLAGFVAFLQWMDDHQVEPIDTEKVVYGK